MCSRRRGPRTVGSASAPTPRGHARAPARASSIRPARSSTVARSSLRPALEPDVVRLGLRLATAVCASASACSSSPRAARRSASAAGAITRIGRTRRDGPSLTEPRLRLLEATEVAEVARERQPGTRRRPLTPARITSIISALCRHARSGRLRSSRSAARYAVPLDALPVDLAQVARPRLGERPRLVDAVEHCEQGRPRQIPGSRRPPGVEFVDHP